MSGPDISHQIAGLIEVTEGIAKAYDPIKDLRGLPEAFQEVNKLLPLVEQTLRDAKSPAKKFKSDDDAKALETVLYSCDDKADKLLEIFKKIAKNSKDQYDSSVYREIIIKQGKHRVETLMDGILEDLRALVAHYIFPAEMQRQVEPLADAREELAKVSPSLADSDLAQQPGAANQYGDNNRQYNLFGEGTQKIADGHYFEAQGNQNFDEPAKLTMKRKRRWRSNSQTADAATAHAPLSGPHLQRDDVRAGFQGNRQEARALSASQRQKAAQPSLNDHLLQGSSETVL